MRPRIGIDLGGTKIEGVVLAGDRDAPRELARSRIPTQADGGYDHLVTRVASFIEELAEQCGLDQDTPAGVGMPGSVTATGLVKNSNTVCLNGTPFRDAVAQRLSRPVVFANDANCFALAEAVMGAGVGHTLVFGVIMGTGTGGGLVIDGAAWEGPQSIAGEWGHTVLRPDSDRRCYCGQRGCTETYLAGPWIARHYKQLSGRRASLAEIIEGRNGDDAADECISVWLEHYGRAMANLLNVLDPDIVILGGGVANADCLYDEGRRHVAEYVFTDDLLTPIVRNSLGDSAGVLGAALLVDE